MHALRVIYAIWLRELKAFYRERTRIVAMLSQPLFYLLIVGQGIASGLTLNAAPHGLNYLAFLYPGILGMSVLFTSMFSAVSIIWDREFGLLKEVLVAPVPRWAVAMGKVLGGATVAMLQCLILIALMPLVGLRYSLLPVLQLLALSFLISVAITSLGVTIAARMRSMQGFQMLMNLLIMPLYFLSGAMFPIMSAPAWMRALMLVDPLSYGVDALRNVVLAGVPAPGSEEGTLAELARAAGQVRWSLATDVSVLALAAVVLVSVAAFRFGTAD
jgi:ABC-2 type transport system permease protein